MDLSATYIFPAGVERTWSLLLDTNAIASCLPGCRSLEPLGGDRYAVELASPIAAIAGQFKGTVALENKVPLESYTLVVDGSGRQGFIKG
jgi:carbon monoxide dehydrogenase subunit G